MLLRATIIALFASALIAVDGPDTTKVPKTLAEIVGSTPSATFVRCLDHHDIVAVYCEREPQWSGRLFIYQRSGEDIDWQYSYPDSYEEFRGHYVVRFRWIPLKQTMKPVLEVIESTYMGNGSLRVWELDGRTLRLLLETTVRGRYWDASAVFAVPEHGEARFDGDHLAVEYQRPSGEEFDSIHLSGSIQITDIEGRAIPSRKYEQVCRWDPAKRVFVAQAPTSP
ncbi:hypothetical protein [Phragmitibacter flavus]|nr:hypothetical protein [Phragmitibacter flavus]